MKSLVVLLLTLNVTFLSVGAMASVENLDKIPRTKEEAAKMVRMKKIEIENSKEMDANYLELLIDTSETARNTRLAAFTSFMAMKVLLAPLGIVSSVADLTVAGGAAGSFASGTVDSLEIHRLKSLGIDENTYTKVKNILEEFSPCQDACEQNLKYTESKKILDDARSKVMNEYFDGSIKNMLMDHVRLGGLSREGAKQLLLIHLTQTMLLEQELTDLQTAQKVLAGN